MYSLTKNSRECSLQRKGSTAFTAGAGKCGQEKEGFPKGNPISRENGYVCCPAKEP